MGAFFLAVAVVCAITMALTVLMIVADMTLGNYGDVTIRINDQKDLTVPGGGNLLSALKEEQIFIPSACGGRGSCGLCKVRVLEGAGAVLPTETPWLTEEEQQQQVRLACQIKLRNDLRIEIPEELFAVKQYTTEVSSLRDLTHDIKEVRLKLLEPAEMPFVAGQFVQFEVPPYELTADPVYRAYSISSAPQDPSEIELEIRYVPNGICTTYVHRHLKVGDRVTINGPHGEFRLTETDREILCIAGGSGMAPIKSILLDMQHRGIRRKTRYFFGARSRRDLFLLEDMQALEHSLDDFTFIPALSAPAEEDDWDGEQGLVPAVVERHLDDGSGMEAYLCGSPLLIDACVEVLTKKGVPEERIYYDKFA